MNNHIYNPEQKDHWLWPRVTLIGGWEFENYSKNGYYAGIYSRIKADGSKEYALVSKGTEPTSLRDWQQNFKQFAGCSEDVDEYLIFVNTFILQYDRNTEITLIGHSKGGAEAAVAAVVYDKNAILFNPAAANLSNYKEKLADYYSSMMVYIVNNEPLNALEKWVSKPIDQVTYLEDPYPDGWNPIKLQKVLNALDRHAMWGVLKAMDYDTGWRINIVEGAKEGISWAKEGLMDLFSW